jgi:hypothetical protein
VGGIGSGRLYKNPIESSFCRLDVRNLHGQGKLSVGTSFALEWKRGHKVLARVFIAAKASRLTIRLQEWRDDGIRSEVETVDLTWTPCRFGGKRPWFVCPTKGCDRRVAILYGKDGFACRRCRRFSYPSQRIPPNDRALARAQDLRIRLGGSVDISQPIPPKPKGMHTWTYTRLCLRLLWAESEANAELSAWLKTLGQRGQNTPNLRA